jgi:hypothetical protein
MSDEPTTFEAFQAATAELVGRAFFSASNNLSPELANAFKLVCLAMAQHMTDAEMDRVEGITMLDMRDPYIHGLD